MSPISSSTANPATILLSLLAPKNLGVVILYALVHCWWTSHLCMFVGLMVGLLALPSILVNIMYTISMLKRKKQPQDFEMYPGFPLRWHRTQLSINATVRLFGKRSMPGFLAQPFNSLMTNWKHNMLETRALPLAKLENSVFSQFGEDGVTVALFDQLGHGSKYYVEFGTEDGSECCTRVLMEKHGWKGLLMDGGNENPSINLCKEFIDAGNIETLFNKYSVPKDFDFLVIDIDGNDFYVWDAVKHYSPRVVCIEFNSSFGLEDKVIKYNDKHCWDFTNYFSASITSYTKLARLKGYSLVHCTYEGLNLYYVRDDLVGKLGSLVPKEIINCPEKIYQPCALFGPMGGHLSDPQNRKFVTSDEAIKIGITIK
jgi:hypothetical protein